jgi:aminoglycoside phosphotransferase family enzyme/predicted kinase
MLIESLRQTPAYPHPVADVSVLETHISWVILAGDFAYKIKKPLRLEFLDYSTLELRRHFCEEELRLNRRLAPDLYLDVVAICGNPAAPVFGGDGEPIEYAVRMRRFPQEMLLSRLMRDGALQPAQIDLLVREIAGFHAGIARASMKCGWGAPDGVRQQALDNLDALALIDDPQLSEQLESLRAWTERAWGQLRGTLEQRRGQGFVRECHGDLHLGNMVWLEGRVVLFDGIEFNESLRWIDVLSDAGFVAMDLMDRGRTDYARRFINGYLERTGDYAGLAVLPFYIVYRALVRAKVAGIRMRQSADDGAARDRVARELNTYLQLAAACTRRALPVLAITCGPSGSGKTTGTQPLVERDGMIRVRSDVERKRLCGLSPEQSAAAAPGRGIYTSATSRLTYDRLAGIARDVIAAGYPVIIDATFLKRAHRDRFHRLADELRVPFRIIPFEADEAALRSRVRSRSRGSDASDADEAVLDYQLGHFESLGEEERGNVMKPG